jgi:hypothetical protein
MSPISNRLERLAQQYGCPELEILEFFNERAAIREYDGGLDRESAEAAAVEDTEIWAKLWIQLKGEPGPQLVFRPHSSRVST